MKKTVNKLQENSTAAVNAKQVRCAFSLQLPISSCQLLPYDDAMTGASRAAYVTCTISVYFTLEK